MSMREKILNCDDIKHEVVSVPEWGLDVRVCVMNGLARDKFDHILTTMAKEKNLNHIRATLAVFTVRDEENKLIFSHGDIDALSEKSSAALDRIFAVAQRLNGLTNADVEELQKN